MKRDIAIHNRGISFHYEILDKFVAGIELKGFEVKAIKTGRGNLTGSYISNIGEELFLINFQIPPYQPKNTPKDYNERRARKLLLQKKQIKFLIGKLKEKGLTVVPLKIFVKKGLIKVEIALAKGLKKYEKREKIKKREFERERDRTLKGSSFVV